MEATQQQKLNQYARRIFDRAKKAGFAPDGLSVSHQLALTMAEIGEVINADRNGRVANPELFDDLVSLIKWSKGDGATQFVRLFRKYIKDTVEDEMADVTNLLLEVGAMMNTDFTRPGSARYQRDFDEFDFCENAFGLMKGITNPGISLQRRLIWAVDYVFNWFDSLHHKGDNDLWWYIDRKMDFNTTRGPKNGKRY